MVSQQPLIIVNKLYLIIKFRIKAITFTGVLPSGQDNQERGEEVGEIEYWGEEEWGEEWEQWEFVGEDDEEVQEHNLRLSTNFREARVQCASFRDTRQIERRDGKCKEWARQTKWCKSRSSHRTNRLAGFGFPTIDKSFEKIGKKSTLLWAARVMQGSKVQNSAIAKKHDYRAVNCNEFVTVGDRRKQLGLEQLCFNCTGSRHRAAECKCRSGCQICGWRHHTSIGNKPTSWDQLMTTTSVKRKGVSYRHSWRERC